jgi:hypothetical protein
MGACLCQQLAGPRRYEWKRIHLAMRVVKSYADLLAAILEAVHMLHTGDRAEYPSSIGPRLQHGANATGGETRERRIVIGGKAYDFAPAVAGPLGQR